MVTEKTTILAVDSNRSGLQNLAQQLEQEGYEVVTAASLEELRLAIQGKKMIDLALIYLSGFNQDIWEHCDGLRHTGIPFIIISPQRSPKTQRDSLKHGASGVLLKPLGVKELLEHIHTMVGG